MVEASVGAVDSGEAVEDSAVAEAAGVVVDAGNEPDYATRTAGAQT